jgi:ESF2/ABP1 family protein
MTSSRSDIISMGKNHKSDSDDYVDENDEEIIDDDDDDDGSDNEESDCSHNNDDEDDDDDKGGKGSVSNSEPNQRKVFKLSQTKSRDFTEALRRRGVVYMSRIPPRMNPAKVKQLLSPLGTITRVFLVEEDSTIRQRRRKNGYSGAKRYVEGWIEFENKSIAKRIAMSLNLTPISNQKRNVHYGELWNLKYLRKFRWEHLTEKVAYERRVREQKLRVELLQARKENAAYAQLVETGQKLDKIEDRKRKRGEVTDVPTSDVPRQLQPVDPTDRPAKSALLSSLV